MNTDKMYNDDKTAGEIYVYDPYFDGPKKERARTDVSFMIIFTIVIISWMGMGFWAIATSDFTAKISNSTLNFDTNGGLHNDKDNAETFNRTMLPIFIGLILSTIAAMLFILSMRWFATSIAWTFIVIYLGIFLAAAIFSFINYAKATLNPTSFLIYGLISSGIFVLFSIYFIIMRKRIKFGIALIKESSRKNNSKPIVPISAIASMWSTLFFPLISALVKIVVIEFSILVHFCLWDLSEKSNDGYYQFLAAFNVVACVWELFFISALSEITLAGAFCTWYWTYDKLNVPYFTVAISATRAAIYHTGTAAFGALLITICTILRIITNRHTSGQCGICGFCLRCFFAWLTDFLKRFNRNAYIMCALHGKGLCASAIDAYKLILRNVLRYVATDVVTNIIFVFAKLILTCIAGVLCWLYFNNHYKTVPVSAVGILIVGVYLIASEFFNVYTIAVHTLMLCALEDIERNDGSIEHPYYMSQRLMKLLAKENKTDTYRPMQDESTLHFNKHF